MDVPATVLPDGVPLSAIYTEQVVTYLIQQHDSLVGGVAHTAQQVCYVPVTFCTSFF